MTNVNTTTQLIAAVAEALRNEEIELLYDLADVAGNWMLPPDEEQAIRELLEAAIETLGGEL